MGFINSSLQGIVTPVIRKVVDGEYKEVKRFPTCTNAITNKYMGRLLDSQGFVYIFGNGQDLKHVFLGTGTSVYTPATEEMGNRDGSAYGSINTSLEQDLDYIDNGDGTYYSRYKIAYVFALGEIVGTFTEYGLYRLTHTGSNNELLAGSLFKDTAGDPVAITVAADEQFILYYEFRMPLTAEEYTQITSSLGVTITRGVESPATTVNINGTDHTVTIYRDKFRVYRLAEPTTAGATIALLGTVIEGGHLSSGKVLDDQGDAYGINTSSSGGNIAVTGALSPAGDSITREFVVTLAPSSGLANVEEIQFANYSSATSTLFAVFDPPVPIPAGDKLTFTYTSTTTWS